MQFTLSIMISILGRGLRLCRESINCLGRRIMVDSLFAQVHVFVHVQMCVYISCLYVAFNAALSQACLWSNYAGSHSTVSGHGKKGEGVTK